ncbi:MAG: MoxR family ATPase, partial [Actinomycetes bacterium]
GAELAMLQNHAGRSPLESMDAVATADQVMAAIAVVRRVYVSDDVHRYAIALVTATRTSNDLRLGASPRATLQLIRASKAAAALDGRDYVVPDDVRALAVPVLAHRLLPTAEAQIARRTPEVVVERIVESTPVPGS